MSDSESQFMALVHAIVLGETPAVQQMLRDSPLLATAHCRVGATRQHAVDYYSHEMEHYIYAGDTALHIAAAAYQPEIVDALIAAGADVRARNRRGAEAIHYAADGAPGTATWHPEAQAATIARLIAAGADPNATDNSSVTALHRAVRCRCAAAVSALLQGGANAKLPKKSGSTPMKLANLTTGRGGSGSAEAKAQQALIVRLLEPMKDDS